MFPFWEKPADDAGSADADAFDFDFDMPSTPRFSGFPQPISISVSSTTSRGVPTTDESTTSLSPPPTPLAKLAKAKSATDVRVSGEEKSYVVATFTCAEFAEWVDNHLSINETRYPVISHKGSGHGSHVPKYEEEWVKSAPGMSPPKPAMFKADDSFAQVDDSGVCTPVCTYVRAGDVRGWEPQVVAKRQSVLIHIVAPGNTPKPKNNEDKYSPRADGGGLFGLSNLSIGATGEGQGNDAETINADDGNDADVSYEEDGSRPHVHRKLTKQESEGLEDIPEGELINRDLPPLYVQSCVGTNIYLLGSYSSAAVTGCIGCEIVIGAVHGVIRLIGCEKVRLTVACRKLVVVNCSDCTINVACVKPTVLIGENKALSIGIWPCFLMLFFVSI